MSHSFADEIRQLTGRIDLRERERKQITKHWVFEDSLWQVESIIVINLFQIKQTSFGPTAAVVQFDILDVFERPLQRFVCGDCGGADRFECGHRL